MLSNNKWNLLSILGIYNSKKTLTEQLLEFCKYFNKFF